MNVQDDELLLIAARVLVVHPTATLGDVARAAGMSRTSLHTRYPTRQALLVALAHSAMDQVERVYREARLDDQDVDAALRRIVESMVPLGSSLEFLLRERSLDAEEELQVRYATVDEPVLQLVRRAQATGRLRADVPAWWIVEAAFGAIYAAWEAIALGRLAPRDAPDIVLTTILDGARPR